MASCDQFVFSNATEGAKLVSANSKFALSLYKHHASTSTGNLFMSPISISVALAMTYLGSRGETMTQIRNTLFFSDVSDAQLHSAFAELHKSLSVVSGKYILHMANRLFGEKTFNFLPEFLGDGRKHYAAELAAVDFVKDASGATSLINQWVAEQTNHKITDIIPSGALDSETRLVLVNAVYFKGNWKDQFKPELTQDGDFHVTPSETVRAKLMYRKGKYRYGVDPELVCQALELPYVDAALSMFVLLPDPSTNLATLESKLTAEHLMDVETKFNMHVGRDVKVWLPRFKLDERLDLVDTLTNLGAPDMFSPQSADFSGMDGTRNLYVSRVLHRAFVEVNEEGSEAAAVTAAVMMTRCAMVSKEFDFRADHPFIFFIRDNASKSVLFLGRFTKP